MRYPSLQDVTLRHCLVSDLSWKSSGLILGGPNVQGIVTLEGAKILLSDFLLIKIN
jgi:hypothetical protein